MVLALQAITARLALLQQSEGSYSRQGVVQAACVSCGLSTPQAEDSSRLEGCTWSTRMINNIF